MAIKPIYQIYAELQEYEPKSNSLGIEDLDLDKFDLEDLNFRLKKLPRIFKDSYEYGLEPTKGQ